MWVSNIIQKHANKLIIFKTQLTVKWQKFAAKNDSIQRSHHLLLARMQHSISRRYFNQLFNHSYQARVLLEG